MTAVQQYWLVSGGGLFASKFYPPLIGPESFASTALLTSARVLTYNPDQIEAFSSAAALLSVAVGTSNRWDVLYQPPEAFSGTSALLSGAFVQFQSVGVSEQAPEAFASAAALLASSLAQFARVPVTTQAPEAFSSVADLISASLSTARVALLSQQAEAFSSDATLVSGLFFVPPPTYSEEVLADAPLGYWRLEESSGNWLDSSGNGYHAIPGNRTLTRGRSPNITEGFACQIGGAAATNPAIGIVANAPVWRFGANPFTYELWLRGAAGSGDVIGAKYNEGVTWPEWFYVIVAGSGTAARIRVEYRTANAPATAYLQETPDIANLNDGAPHHVVIVRAVSAVLVYVDGVKYTLPAFGGTLWASNAPTGIGGTPSALARSCYSGTLDEIAIYSYALPEARVLAHYNRGKG